MNNGESEECSFNNLILGKQAKPGYIIINATGRRVQIGVRYKSGCRDGNYNMDNLNGKVALNKKDDGSGTPHILKAVTCSHMAALLCHRMKKAGHDKIAPLRTEEEIKQERDKVDLTTYWKKAYPTIREIIESEHIGKYLFSLHDNARGNPTCVLICTGCHALALRIREKQKDDLKYTVIEAYDPNNTFFYRIVLEKTNSIQELNYKMLFGTDFGNKGIIFCQTSMPVDYQADMSTIIRSLRECQNAIRNSLPREDSITPNLPKSHLYYALYVINKPVRRNRNEHITLINEITQSKETWGEIEKYISEKISVNYYDIITLLYARDLLIKECCSIYNLETTSISSPTDTGALKRVLNSGIFRAGQLGIFKTPYAILFVIANIIGTDTIPKSFLVAATYIIIINTILLPIEYSVAKLLHHKITELDIMTAVVGTSIFSAFFIPTLTYAFEKHMQGKMPYSNYFKKRLLRAIEKKQAENKSGQTGSELGTMEEPFLISANDIDNNSHTQYSSNFFTNNNRGEDLNHQQYCANTCRIM